MATEIQSASFVTFKNLTEGMEADFIDDFVCFCNDGADLSSGNVQHSLISKTDFYDSLKSYRENAENEQKDGENMDFALKGAAILEIRLDELPNQIFIDIAD